MKINSKDLWNYINDLTTNEKVKFNVYYDDNYVTQIYWNGDNFEWEPGRFTSEAFFNPLYDFEVIEGEKIPEKITINENGTIGFPNGQWTARNMDKAFAMKINSIIDYLKSKGE